MNVEDALARIGAVVDDDAEADERERLRDAADRREAVSEEREERGDGRAEDVSQPGGHAKARPPRR